MRFVIPLIITACLAACGGGSGGGGNSSTTATENDEARVIPKTNTTTGSVIVPTATPSGILIADAAAPTVASKVLVNSTFDTSVGSIGTGWAVNYWSGGSASASLETAGAGLIAGTKSQKFTVITRGSGDAQLYYAYAFQKGKRYRVTAKLRAQSSTGVSLFIRRDSHPYDSAAINSKVIGTTTTTISAEGIYGNSDPGSIRITVDTPGVAVYVDDVVLEEVTVNAVAPVTHGAAPGTLFGMVINKFGHHQAWPQLGFKVVRLWDTGTTWSLLEPCDNCWDFSTGGGKRMDLLVNYVLTNDPTASILYTMGQTPTWGAANPAGRGLYGAGANSAPKDMAVWRRYVKTLANRYKGKIRYWELWNEADFWGLYEGSIDTMVEMARIAREELKAADPQNMIVSPSYTGSGLQWLNAFFASGGKNYIDLVSIHGYYAVDTDTLLNGLSNLRQVMKNNGIENKPIWNTEGGLSCTISMASCLAAIPGSTGSVQSSALPVTVQRGALARAFAIMWTNGVANFNYYTMEGTRDTPPLVDSSTGYDVTTPLGVAYFNSSQWIVGSSLQDAYLTPEGIYVFKIRTAAGKPGYMLWSTKGTLTVRTQTTWPITKIMRLDGTSQALKAGADFSLTAEPVMLQ